MVHGYNGRLFSTEKNDPLPYTVTWMNLTDIICKKRNMLDTKASIPNNSIYMKFKITRQLGSNIPFLTLGDVYTGVGFVKIHSLIHIFVLFTMIYLHNK